MSAVLDRPKGGDFLAGLLASYGRFDAITGAGREWVRPGVNGLSRDADQLGRFLDRTPQKSDSTSLVHAPLEHSSGCGATIIVDDLRKVGAMGEYGRRLGKALLGAKRSRAELADACGISVSAIGHVISGRAGSLSAENNARAAVFLGVDPFWLATGETLPNAAKQPMPFRDLSSLEAQLITLFRQLNAGEQEAVVVEVDAIVADRTPAAKERAPELPGMSDFGNLESSLAAMKHKKGAK